METCGDAGGRSRNLLRDHGWDAVLCDYNMPHIKAEEAVEIVRAHDDNLPFILVSGTVDASVAVGMMRKGMHEYVMKDELVRLGPALEREIRDANFRKSERLAKAELFALQKRFYDTFEQSSVGIAQLDRQARVMWANAQLAEMLGYTNDELIGLPCEKLTWPEDWPAEQERQQALLEGRTDEYRIDKRYRRRDGSPIWTLLTLTAIKDDAGKTSYLSAVVQDISDLKKAEDRVRSSEAFTRAVLDSMPFEVAVVDRAGIIRHVNTAWEMFARENGLESLDKVGTGASYLDACPPDLRKQLDRVIAGTKPLVSEYPCHSPREERWFLMQAAPLNFENGGAVISHVDISSRVLTEQALERREREYRSIVETMSEGLAHSSIWKEGSCSPIDASARSWDTSCRRSAARRWRICCSPRTIGSASESRCRWPWRDPAEDSRRVFSIPTVSSAGSTSARFHDTTPAAR